MISNTDRQARRAQAQKIAVSVHVGKSGIDSAIPELQAQLKKRKLVKVRLLPAATEGGVNNKAQAEALATATESDLIEVRGHTAVFWRA